MSEHVQSTPETAQDRSRQRTDAEDIGKWTDFDPELADLKIEEALQAAQKVAHAEMKVSTALRGLSLSAHDSFLSLVSQQELDRHGRRLLSEKIADGIRLPDEIMERFRERDIPATGPISQNLCGGYFEFLYQSARVDNELSTPKEATDAIARVKTANATGVEKHRYGMLMFIAIDMKDRKIITSGMGLKKAIELHNKFKKVHPTLALPPPVKPPTKAEIAAKAELAASDAERAKQNAAIQKTKSAIESAPTAAPGIDPFGDPIKAETPAETAPEAVKTEAPAQTAPEATKTEPPAVTAPEAAEAQTPVVPAPEVTKAEAPPETAPEAAKAEAPAATSFNAVKAEVPEEWFSFKDGFRQSVSKKPVPFKLTKAVRTEFRLPDTTDKEVVFRGIIKAGVLFISVVGVQA